MTSKTAAIATDQPLLGGAVGVVLTYWLATHHTEGSKLLLGLVTPVSMMIDRAVFHLFRFAAEEFRKNRAQAGFSKALVQLESELANPHLLPDHKNELHDLRQEIVKGRINNIAFNQPPPSGTGNASATKRKKTLPIKSA